MADKILKIYQTSQTVFTAKEVALIWSETNSNSLKSSLNYYIKKGDLIWLRKGLYVKPNYNKFEIAGKIYAPSYISYETVLQKEGVIFQYYETIFAASYLSREIELKSGEKIQYRRMKKEIIMNSAGIIKEGNYFTAGKERAFLDVIYRNPNYFFDNLRSIDWQKCLELVKIYQSKKILVTLKKYYKNYA